MFSISSLLSVARYARTFLGCSTSWTDRTTLIPDPPAWIALDRSGLQSLYNPLIMERFCVVALSSASRNATTRCGDALKSQSVSFLDFRFRFPAFQLKTLRMFESKPLLQETISRLSLSRQTCCELMVVRFNGGKG